MRLTADELESALAWAIDVAKSEGWRIGPRETISEYRRRCCAIGAVAAIGLVEPAVYPAIAAELGMRPRDAVGVTRGFDGQARGPGTRRYHDMGHNLAMIFMDALW